MKISSIIKSDKALTTQQGEQVKDKIIKKLHLGKRVTLDCGDLTIVSLHFLYPISQILNIYTEEYLKQNLRFTNTSIYLQSLLNQSFQETKNQISNNLKQ